MIHEASHRGGFLCGPAYGDAVGTQGFKVFLAAASHRLALRAGAQSRMFMLRRGVSRVTLERRLRRSARLHGRNRGFLPLPIIRKNLAGRADGRLASIFGWLREA